MTARTRRFGLVLVSILFLFAGCGKKEEVIQPDAILIFHKTMGYRHSSIETGIKTLSEIITAQGYEVQVTEDAEIFQEDTLSGFAAVIFLSTTGDILNGAQQAVFERYIQRGGGFLGIHAAADTEYKWPWYNGLVGGYFESHPNDPNVRKARVTKTDQSHPATSHYEDSFERTDEWYNYRNMDPSIIPLLMLDESSYEGGTMDGNHPITWYHEYDGGRAFYTGFGHTEETFSEEAFRQMIEKALAYVASDGLNMTLASSPLKPDNDRFSKEVLGFNLNEPTELAVLPDERVLFVERRGAVKLYKPSMDSILTIAQLDVYTNQEDGLMGLAIDPDFEENRYVYMYYSPAGDEPVQNLSRFELDQDRLLLYTEKVILQVPVQREECCHTGGSIAFGPEGNLFLSTGDDTNPFASNGYGPLDEREGRKFWDGQRSPANTNDLRGKILRIKVADDGTYSIPEGNLFPPGTPNTKPEIYVMGCRNPYRIHVDRKTGTLYWGDVGPDASDTDSLRGSRGYDEVNRADEPGFHGWPYFIGNNYAYRDYDFETGVTGPYYDPEHPINDSPNNTGLRELPPAKPPLIWYPYSVSEEFPIVRNGSRNAMAGYVYYHDLFEETPESFPAYYDGKLLAYDWMRNWVLAVTMDEEGNLLSLEPFIPHIKFNNLIDMDFSRNGVMYTLEYGTGWFQQNTNARLSRINYNSGNRPPVVRLASTTTTGKTPLTVQFDAGASSDPDGDEIMIEWFIGREKVGEGDTLTYTFDKPGYFFVNAVARDGKDESREYAIVRPGNEPPEITIEVDGNSVFYWGNERLSYSVSVSDEEDGSTRAGSINPSEVIITEDFIEDGYDMTEVAQGHQLPSPVVIGKNLMEGMDCKSCHKIDMASAGPSYTAVAARYSDDPQAIEYLSEKIINGGGGVWGDQAMAAHPDLKPTEAANIVRYILSLENMDLGESTGAVSLNGVLETNLHDPDNRNALYLITASYTDKGNEYGGLKKTEQLVLRHPRLGAEAYAEVSNVSEYANSRGNIFINDIRKGSYLRYDNLDLTSVNSITFFVRGSNESEIILRKNSPDGQILGRGNVTDEGYQRVELNLDSTQGKVENLYVTFDSSFDDTPLMEFDWMEFNR